MQQFEKFVGLPEDLVTRLNQITTGGGTIVEVIVTHVSAVYIIIYT